MIWRGAGGGVRGGSSDRVAASTTAGSREDIAALLERHQSARAGSTGQGRSGAGRARKYHLKIFHPPQEGELRGQHRAAAGEVLLHRVAVHADGGHRVPGPFLVHVSSFIISYLS